MLNLLSQFHVYHDAHFAYIDRFFTVEALSRCFQQGEGPSNSRVGLLQALWNLAKSRS